LNGGLKTFEDIATAFDRGVHGCMVGREFFNNPYYWYKNETKTENSN
jgi:tRNA-dihydrouridine synthase